MSASNTSRWLTDQLTPDRPECLVASTSAGVCAVVLCVSSGRGAAEGEAGGAVHLRGGRLAAAAVAVTANPTEGVLRRRARQTAARRTETTLHVTNELTEINYLVCLGLN